MTDYWETCEEEPVEIPTEEQDENKPILKKKTKK